MLSQHPLFAAYLALTALIIIAYALVIADHMRRRHRDRRRHEHALRRIMRERLFHAATPLHKREPYKRQPLSFADTCAACCEPYKHPKP